MTGVQISRIAMGRSGMSRLSQETLAVIGAAIALAALILTSSAGVHGEIRAVRDELLITRDELRAEIRDVRTDAHADRQALRAEARADREAFQSHILRLTEQQGVLSARVDGLRDPPAPNR